MEPRMISAIVGVVAVVAAIYLICYFVQVRQAKQEKLELEKAKKQKQIHLRILECSKNFIYKTSEYNKEESIEEIESKLHFFHTFEEGFQIMLSLFYHNVLQYKEIEKLAKKGTQNKNQIQKIWKRCVEVFLSQYTLNCNEEYKEKLKQALYQYGNQDVKKLLAKPKKL